MGDIPLYGIIGHPLGHTLSPALHNWALSQAGLLGRYEAWPIAPETLAAFMARMRQEPILGLSVTIPHKLAVMAHLDGVTDTARAVGAVNTLSWQGDRLMGDNTDAPGFAQALLGLPRLPASALVLGAGGAARAVLAGLAGLGLGRIHVANRTMDRAEALAAEFKARAVAWEDRLKTDAELIVNTTPLGMQGHLQEASPLPEDACLSPNQTVYDIVYNPLETVLLRQAKACGCPTIDGLSMFIHQANLQFRLWTGQTFDPTRARKLLLGLL